MGYSAMGWNRENPPIDAPRRPEYWHVIEVLRAELDTLRQRVSTTETVNNYLAKRVSDLEELVRSQTVIKASEPVHLAARPVEHPEPGLSVLDD